MSRLRKKKQERTARANPVADHGISSDEKGDGLIGRPVFPPTRAPMTSYCIFQEPWWLDAVAADSWQSLEVTRGTQVVARMPIVPRRICGFTIIRQPPLTPTLGPWIELSGTTMAKRLTEEKKIFNDLIDQLPKWDYIQLNFNHRITNWLPFYWRGLKQTTRYTYILNDISDLGKVWLGLAENVRRHIRIAERCLTVRNDLSVETLLDIVELTFSRQGRRLPFRRELFRCIEKACVAHDARRVFFAQDAEGRIHAALYLVMDASYAYNLLGGADPRLRNSGAQSLLHWEAIKLASQRNLKFDFEGSMIEPIERFFRAFGAVQVPYLQVYGATALVKALLLIRELIHK
jgi:hypothetical protein